MGDTIHILKQASANQVSCSCIVCRRSSSCVHSASALPVLAQPKPAQATRTFPPSLSLSLPHSAPLLSRSSSGGHTHTHPPSSSTNRLKSRGSTPPPLTPPCPPLPRG